MTGQPAWRTRVDDTDIGLRIDLAIGEHVIVACSLNKLSFVEYATGKLLGSVFRSERARPTMLVDGDQILIAGRETLACYATDGRLRWSHDLDGVGAVSMGFLGNVRQATD